MTTSPPLSDSPQHSNAPLIHTTDDPRPFSTEPLGATRGSESSNSSDQTSSDKLSALPGPSSPPLGRPSRTERYTSVSAPSLERHPDRDAFRATTSEGSASKGSPHQRVSFENDRVQTPPGTRSPVHVHPLLRETASVPSRASILDAALSRLTRISDPTRPPPGLPRGVQTPRKASYDSPVSPSGSHSRATSPIRRLQQWSGFHRPSGREEPFVPVDPFQLRSRLRRLSGHNADPENNWDLNTNCDDVMCCLPLTCNPRGNLNSLVHFISDTLPRQVYLHLLLRLPSLYFSRIARIYEDAEVSRPDVQRMIDFCLAPRVHSASSPFPPGTHTHPGPILPFPEEWTTTNVPPALVRFKHSWEAFVDSLLREWKTFNLVSALLLSYVNISFNSGLDNWVDLWSSAILSMFQNTQMANDPVTRTAALFSLTCALMSLSYGCVYIVRFGTMRSMYKATRWAEEARKTTTFIWWNVWVLLAMPAVWLAWSMIFFIFAILSFVWRSGSSQDPPNPAPLPPKAALGPRIAITFLFVLGLLYFALIVKTLHNYGRTRNEDRQILNDNTGQSGRNTERHTDPEREDRGRERERGRTGRGGERGRDRVRNDARGRAGDRQGERPDGGALSAVTGLGLTGLDGQPIRPLPGGSLVEFPTEKDLN
ncbi:hypothetical protein BJ138DRAFT_1108451 [Hygrophoropsis aurantiaca]|uniref:Uncharacterized protein n=1 Tax=Hygrophoropsis aurantiaca TaxID=72124 RepID=A0ACB8AU01_9AGAM|nr:hypothetical protein BJ138DRAFT_1108451 [Hygrophoropsis aurantiaca]